MSLPAVLKVVFKDILLGKVKDALSKENLNPVTSPSTGVAYTTSGALAYLVANPPGTEYDVAMQAVTALVAVISFFYKKQVKKED